MWFWRSLFPRWRREPIHIWSVASGLGDEIMVLGAAQGLVKQFPQADITLHARHINVIGGGRGAVKIVEFTEGNLPSAGIGIRYQAKHRFPIIEQMGRELGVRLLEFPILLDEKYVVEQDVEVADDRIVIVVQTSASAWTLNKQWIGENWKSLIEMLPTEWAIVEVGNESVLRSPPRHPRFRTMVGATSINEYVATIRRASLFVGPVSSGMHLAHAFQIPSVIIVGGYELGNHPYPLAHQFGTKVKCAPCWLRTPCPYDRRCLREITPKMVVEEIHKILKKGSNTASGFAMKAI
ncbi:glycosyltransferase family 9 protein [Phragmitibacter flavus]|uniref:glycosyltransferase family 9 protein n=1 Tax=Phragmitibacter flavus TaxID=2576071 RepID=UPI00140BB679|nr:glycosyltransferase family 9 protein [Phragmitibacter flavus]